SIHISKWQRDNYYLTPCLSAHTTKYLYTFNHQSSSKLMNRLRELADVRTAIIGTVGTDFKNIHFRHIIETLGC
ncbi:MAG: hypothetical protein ACMG6E_04895, partial [Candidatus Roizmanbacteria bacterium]